MDKIPHEKDIEWFKNRNEFLLSQIEICLNLINDLLQKNSKLEFEIKKMKSTKKKER